MTLAQNVKIALSSIGGNLTRTVITCMIIAIGITALVGMLTAIDGVESSLVKNFSFMGANTLNISKARSTAKEKDPPSISYRQAVEFKERFKLNAKVSVNANVSFSAIAKYGKEKSNPNLNVIGGDENYLSVAGYKIAEGRSLNQSDVDHNLNVVVIGNEVKNTLFGKASALNKYIRIGGVKLLVVGVMDVKGGSFDFGGDRLVLVPVTFARNKFAAPNTSYNIGVAVPSIEAMERSADYSTVLFRQVRKLGVREESDFVIRQSDAFIQSVREMLQYLLVGAGVIAGITLLGAAIALMNIMLVTVTERTREIGTRKAIGAKRSSILWQFVVEAITVCLIGGSVGVVLGIVVGNATSNYIGGEFIVPWDWIIMALVVCTVVGVVAGIWPAIKASKVDPIEALRHE